MSDWKSIDDLFTHIQYLAGVDYEEDCWVEFTEGSTYYHASITRQHLHSSPKIQIISVNENLGQVLYFSYSEYSGDEAYGGTFKPLKISKNDHLMLHDKLIMEGQKLESQDVINILARIIFNRSKEQNP